MSNIEKIAVFGFGIIFLSAILVLVVLIPMPSITQFFAFRLTMALSAAGIGALLPGFLRLDVPLPMQGGIRAGGALALFASVWFANPATLGIEVQPPKEDARLLIDRFLNLTDARDHKAAYTLYSKRNKERVSEDAYMSMSKQVRDPLGSIGQRLLVSAGTPDEVNGVRGPFVFHTYQGRFSDSKDVWAEVVSTIPENGTWRINSYNIGRCDPPFCIPVASLLP
ncbi:DUF4019 domain-containing protein [Methylogaea oryzae]|uniref:DUF4019 domain-containing protein n=1 Tax=Methylogaea oryzae TaxID=1295382 RepID=A0A8D5AHK3_9GAMM|nr:DUF4019 domain-containing protein [Methylogaea oryzae]BBL71563.1 hypothetical protein MoryE10_21690 [Methylogaea oryzae]